MFCCWLWVWWAVMGESREPGRSQRASRSAETGDLTQESFATGTTLAARPVMERALVAGCYAARGIALSGMPAAVTTDRLEPLSLSPVAALVIRPVAALATLPVVALATLPVVALATRLVVVLVTLPVVALATPPAVVLVTHPVVALAMASLRVAPATAAAIAPAARSDLGFVFSGSVCRRRAQVAPLEDPELNVVLVRAAGGWRTLRMNSAGQIVTPIHVRAPATRMARVPPPAQRAVTGPALPYVMCQQILVEPAAVVTAVEPAVAATVAAVTAVTAVEAVVICPSPPPASPGWEPLGRPVLPTLIAVRPLPIV